MMILLIVAGLALLAGGGEALVRGATGAARHLGVSEIIIGVTLVGFGTSMPELVTSLKAALEGAPGIAVGNVVGSNIANILLVLGAAALIKPIITERASYGRDGYVALGATLALIAVMLVAGGIGHITGAVFALAMIAYLVLCVRQESQAASALAAQNQTDIIPFGSRTRLALPSIGLALAGMVGTVLGADLLVDGAVQLAQRLGVSESVIGLTIVAFGTSLPELAATVMAAARGNSGIAVGGVLGSNIYNILTVLGVTALVHPVPVAPEMARFDSWVMLAAILVLLVFFHWWQRLSRLQGGLFVVSYSAYIGWLALTAA